MGVGEENVVVAGISAVEVFGSGDGDDDVFDVAGDVDDDAAGAAVADAEGAGSAVGGRLVADGMHS